MIPLIMAGLSLAQQKAQQDEAQKQNLINTMNNTPQLNTQQLLGSMQYTPKSFSDQPELKQMEDDERLKQMLGL